MKTISPQDESQSKKIKNALYAWWKQSTIEKDMIKGVHHFDKFEDFYNHYTEKYIESIKNED